MKLSADFYGFVFLIVSECSEKNSVPVQKFNLSFLKDQCSELISIYKC